MNPGDAIGPKGSQILALNTQIPRLEQESILNQHFPLGLL